MIIKKIYRYYLYYLLLFLLLIIIKNVNAVNVSNESEFKNALISNYANIKITSSFSLENSYTFNSEFDNIIIHGVSKDITLSFHNETNGLYFKENQNINIKNLSIKGNLYITNCTNTNISDTNLYGFFKGDILKNHYITFKNVIYENLQHKTLTNGLYINNGVFTIDKSTFYGSSSISESIIEVVNSQEDKNVDIIIKNSIFSGEYINRIINAENTNIIINNSNFTNGYSLVNGLIEK